MMGPGGVAVFQTTIKEDFPVIVTCKSKALGTVNRFRLNLSATGTAELGHMQGAAIFPGDEITVENNEYESISVICPEIH